MKVKGGRKGRGNRWQVNYEKGRTRREEAGREVSREGRKIR